jgi:hypothetical protein
MKKQIVLAAAVLGVAAAQAVPTAASRAEARAKAEALVRRLTGDECVSEQLMQFGMDGKQSLAKGEYTVFVGGGQPGFTAGVMSAKLDL